MLKKLLNFLCFSAVLVFIACVPPPKVMPPLYEESLFTLEEVIARAGSDIGTLKAITDIRIEKNREPYSFINASVVMKKPEWVHVRMYQLGILVRDFVIRDDVLHVLSGKNDGSLLTFGKELYSAIFWWEGYRDGVMENRDETYRISGYSREIVISRDTLLPVTQDIRTLNKQIHIEYGAPAGAGDFWYPESLTIFVDDFTFTVTVKKLLKNPALGEADFQVPAGS
ncbi:MAG: hypothetical protein JSU90_07470 [Nitrospiraceae bacterium]|nr:MAG: hypothetical protein JSU90_07470 [Nitrospiraceae bacterium]